MDKRQPTRTTPGSIAIGSGLSGNLDAVLAAEAACESAAGPLESVSPDVVIAFISGDHIHEAERVADVIRSMMKPEILLACSASGVCDGSQGIEEREGISLLAASLPGASLDTFVYRDLPHVVERDQTEYVDGLGMLAEAAHVRDDSRAVMLLVDPFSVPPGSLVSNLSQLPRVVDGLSELPIVGGMASGATAPGNNVLIHNDQVMRTGGVGLTISGDITVDAVVSQGCRPIGRPMVVTDASRNIIKQLGGRPALRVLQDIVENLDERDRGLLKNGMFIGRVINEYKERFGRGDFLVRGVISVDRKSGAIAIGDGVRPGQTVQFQLRDAQTADEDLDLLLAAQSLRQPPHGAVLFTCNGRGSNLFDDAGHDSRMVASKLSAPDGSMLPMAGFYANGEFGPVGDSSFIHGHTASLILFRELQRPHDVAS